MPHKLHWDPSRAPPPAIETAQAASVVSIAGFLTLGCQFYQLSPSLSSNTNSEIMALAELSGICNLTLESSLNRAHNRIGAEKLGHERARTLPRQIENWSLTGLLRRWVRIGGRRQKHEHYYDGAPRCRSQSDISGTAGSRRNPRCSSTNSQSTEQ
jgi:hypothetical protein